MTYTVVEGIERSLFGIFIDENLELLDGDAQVRLVEFVSVNPAKGPVESSLLDDCMEKE